MPILYCYVKISLLSEFKIIYSMRLEKLYHSKAKFKEELTVFNESNYWGLFSKAFSAKG